ncbi:hypothetical protein FRB96_008265 [Tulasnella sp. 330]|nr:hypothetical protein FRB96_008265 [Tulasnella sp. 330]
MATIVSAPGKVLLAGGYLVLDPAHSGVVVSTSSRFYSIIRESSAARSHQIIVRSPQFLEATWGYDVLFSPRGEIGLRPSVSNASKNKFVQLAVERVLFLSMQINGIQAAREATAQGLEIVIVGDNDFYSQRGQLAAMKLPSAIASLAKIPKFAATNCSLADVHKTGLGSSAALITSLVGALLVHFSIISSSSLQTDNEADEGRRLAHNIAQYVHCLAQGKVGSGFDVSSATYGSQIYKRFDPEVLQPLMTDDPFKLPPLTRIMLADVDAGTDTPAAVGKVLAWRKQNVGKAATMWTALSTANDNLAKALMWLTTLHQRSPGAYQTAVSRLVVLPHDKWSALASGDEVAKGFLQVHEISEAIRAKMREMGNVADVPIEPVEQTRLLDACIARPGVIAGGVPGEFKKISEEEKGAAFKTLLKAYQTEIDSLTRRCKTSENAFLNVYKLLAEAPDPYPLLDAAVDQAVKVAEAQTLGSELTRLRSENAELRGRLNEVSSLEVAKKKAEARTEFLEEKMEATIQERVTSKENELNATYDERMNNYEERERDLQRQVTIAKSQLRELQTSTESTQTKLFDQSQRQDQEVVAKLAEVDLIVADLDRANSRVATVERRNEVLRAEIEAVRSGSDSAERVRVLEGQVAELEAESAKLLQAFESQKVLTAEAGAMVRKKTEEAAKELALKTAEIETLKQRIKQYSDYDEIKRELDIMKYVEFSGGDDLEVDGPDALGMGVALPNPNADKANQRHAQSLESLLMAKNKRMLDDLTKLRITYAEAESSLQAMTESFEHCRSELDKERLLTEKLENDLLQVNNTSQQSRLPHQTSGTPTLNGNGHGSGRDTPVGLGLTMAQQDGLAGLRLGEKSIDLPRNGILAPFAPTADTSILPIVTSQRDRFRQRNAELEEELRKQYEIISELRTEIKTLQADNMKLYEKVRYMQSYRDGTGGSVPALSTSAAPISSSNGGAADGISKYSSMYEASMNPFEAFRGREAARAVQSLNPIERGVFVLTRQILGNRRTRLAFIVYALLLHSLVLFTTYGCASSSPLPPHVAPVFTT